MKNTVLTLKQLFVCAIAVTAVLVMCVYGLSSLGPATEKLTIPLNIYVPRGKLSLPLDYRPLQTNFGDVTQKESKFTIQIPELPVVTISPNCSLLFNGDSNEIERVRAVKWTIPSNDDLYQQLDCEMIQEMFHTSKYYVSDKERNFPLAFALNVYESPYQIIRFLKVIYRPHNIYCLHYDKSADESFKNLMITLAKCRPNVIVPRKIADVVWGWHTIIDAQLNCIEDLFEKRNDIPWKYVITLCGKEVPLRTNREMVESLEKLNHTSAVNLRPTKHFEPRYWKYKHVLKNSSINRLSQKLGPVPFDLNISKSWAYYALSDTFVDYLLHNEVAAEFRKFMEDTYIPDEHFVGTLFNTTGVPGGVNEKYSNLIPEVTHCIWLKKQEWENHCSGWNVHKVCIISSGDLHRLDYNPHSGRQTFFHNKFFIEKDRVVMDCAEQELVRRYFEEYRRDN